MSAIEDRLRQAETPATPPAVGQLRQVLTTRRRRRRRQATVAALGVTGLAVAAVAFLDGRPDDEQITTGPAIGGDVPAPSVVEEDPASSTTEASTEADSEWSVLRPGDGWEVDFDVSPNRFVSPPSPPEQSPSTAFAATAPDGLSGPLVRSSFQPGIALEDIADILIESEEMTTPNGATVLVGNDGNRGTLSGLLAIEGGHIQVTAIGLSDDEMLRVIDHVTVTNGQVNFTDSQLPYGLVDVGEIDSSSPVDFHVAVLASRGYDIDAILQVNEVPFNKWLEISLQRAAEPDSEPIVVGEHRALISPGRSGDPANGGNLAASAVLVTPTKVYKIWWLPSQAPVNGSAVVDDLRAFLDELEEWTASEVITDLGMSERADVYGDWLATTPLPPDHELDRLLDGPRPADPEGEAQAAHTVFGCTWIRYWVATGDEAALDALDAHDDWPTAQLIDETDTELSMFPFYVGRTVTDVIDEARQLTTEAERSESLLRSGC